MTLRRRSLLEAIAIAPIAAWAGSALAAPKTSAGLAVADLEVFKFPVNKRGNWIVIRLKTTGGLTGLGDASHGGRDEETIGYLRKLITVLRGRSIFEVEGFRRAAASVIGPSPTQQAIAAASALEHCLWDLMGKALGVPTYDLFGGRINDHIRLYANINRSTDPRTPAGFAAMAAAAVRDGFDAIKLAPFDEMPMSLQDPAKIEAFTIAGIASAQAVRDTIGPKRDLLIDAHSHFGLNDGLALAARLQPLDLFWLEEVTPAKPLENLAAINKAAVMPTAGGESIYGVRGFYPYIAAAAVDIVMPDVKICGGMLELKKIAAMAEGAGLLVSPHGPASPIGNLAAAHVIATVPNFNILEYAYGEVPWRAQLIDPPEQLDSGALTVSSRPGFGASLSVNTLTKYGVTV
jgi:galactonate dehydratase